MKKLVLALLLCAIWGTQAQKTLSADYSVKVSEPYRVVDADYKWLLSNDGDIVSLKFDGKDIYIQRFDGTKPAYLGEKKYESYLPKNYVVEQVKEFKNRYYVFYSSWDGDNQKEQLFAAEVDFAKGEFTGTPRLLLQVNGKISGKYSGRAYDFQLRDKFEILTSTDSKAILVKYRKKPEVKNDKKSFDIIGLGTFDADLKKVSVKEIVMPYTERRMNNLDYQIDNDGNLYMLTKIFHDDSNDDKKKRKDTLANYHVELFTIKSGSDKLNISKLENKDKFITSLWIFDSPSSPDLIAGGYYSNGKGKDFTKSCDGIMTFKMKEDGTVSEPSYYDIPVELINEYESGKTKRKNEKKEEKGEGAKFTDLKLKELKIERDGSMILIGEQTFILAHTTGGNMGSRTYYTYHYNDILATKIDASGKLAWMRKIPKQQTGTNGQGGMSFDFFGVLNEYFLVFLDNVKNIDLPTDKQPAAHTDGKGGYLTGVRIAGADGNYTKGSILNAREVEDFKLHQFSVDRIVKISETSFVLEAYKKSKEDVMIKVTLK